MSVLHFSPLTHHELNARSAEAREACGYRCVTVVQVGGVFEDRDLDFLLEHAAAAKAYQDAAMVRVVRAA